MIGTCIWCRTLTPKLAFTSYRSVRHSCFRPSPDARSGRITRRLTTQTLRKWLRSRLCSCCCQKMWSLTKTLCRRMDLTASWRFQCLMSLSEFQMIWTSHCWMCFILTEVLVSRVLTPSSSSCNCLPDTIPCYQRISIVSKSQIKPWGSWIQSHPEWPQVPLPPSPKANKSLKLEWWPSQKRLLSPNPTHGSPWSLTLSRFGVLSRQTQAKSRCHNSLSNKEWCSSQRWPNNKSSKWFRRVMTGAQPSWQSILRRIQNMTSTFTTSSRMLSSRLVSQLVTSRTSGRFWNRKRIWQVGSYPTTIMLLHYSLVETAKRWRVTTSSHSRMGKRLRSVSEQ